MQQNGISNHCAITFDDQNRLILRDLGSTNGTMVLYNGHEHKRRNFDWIIGGDPVTKNLIIEFKISGIFKFRLVATSYDAKDPQHAQRVARFRAGKRPADARLQALGLSPAPTKPASEAATPVGDDWVFVELNGIARGGQGVVTRVWNAVTGRHFAKKTSMATSSSAKAYLLGELRHPQNLQYVSALCC
jgi:hypothetical protein